MKNAFFLGMILITSLLTANKSFAWGDMGHELVGAIAEDTMSEDAKSLVRGILGIEPMGLSATWPDSVRDDERFGHKDPNGTDNDIHDFSPYHFCEIPVGYTLENRPNKEKKDAYGAITHSLDLIKDPKATREEKMIALRYLIHVTGDIHQPLHVGNGYDRGANACTVVWKSSEKSSGTRKNLHSFWDSEMVYQVQDALAKPDPKNPEKKIVPFYYPDVLKALEAKHGDVFSSASFQKKAKEKYGKGSVADWIEESAALRESVAYPDAPGSMANVSKGEEYKHRPYCLWYVDQEKDKDPAPGSVLDETKLPVLNNQYADKLEPLVEEQLIKGGLRLASLLDKAAAELKKQSLDKDFVTEAQQEKILENVQNTFKNN